MCLPACFFPPQHTTPPGPPPAPPAQVLLSDQAKRSARRRGPAPNGSPAVTPPPGSPGWSPGAGAQSWQALLGALTNVVETLRGEGVPPPAVRALAAACLRFVDAELLNALLLRRDCCSVSAARVLLAGLAELRGWAAYLGPDWCPGPETAAAALERVAQAARYLVQAWALGAEIMVFRGGIEDLWHQLEGGRD